MRTQLLPILLSLSLAADAQTSNWDVHPLNTIPCPEWIYPEQGCDGCGSCRMAMDTHPTMMDGGLLNWSNDLVMCPHPIDNLGHNAVWITNWPIEASEDSYFLGHMTFHQAMHIDTIEVIASTTAGGPDSLEVAVQFNSNDPHQTTTLLSTALSGQVTRHIIANVGAVPMPGDAPGTANVYLRAHGGDFAFVLRGIRVVASPRSMVSISEMSEEPLVLLPVEGGVRVTTIAPVDVQVCDALGRSLHEQKAATGSIFIPLTDGMNVVRLGNRTRKIVR